MKFIALLLTLLSLSVSARDMSERRAFIRENPRPHDCVRCEVDHKVALMNGGVDKKENMQWLPRSEHLKKTRQDFKEYKARKRHERIRKHSR